MSFREILRRSLAWAMVALFLAGSAAEAAGLHHCPHHDAVAGHAAHTAPSHDGDGAGHGCTCFGTCHGSAAVALPIGHMDAHVASDGFLGARLRASTTPTTQDPPYLHPFPHGPPTP